MRYADTLLSDGEIVVMRQRQHWLALILDARTAVVLFLVAALLVAAGIFFEVRAEAANFMGIAALVALAAGLLLFAYRFWSWWAQDYMVTNRRLMKVEGILNKRSADSSLEKINDAVLEQNIVGRLFNYGDLDILTAADTAIDRYRMLNRAKDFKREMLNQKHALDMEISYRQPPSPPLRAMDINGEDRRSEPPADFTPGGDASSFGGAGSTMAPQAGPPAGATAPADGSSPGTGPVPHDADQAREITQTLARLADLRDRGAIDADEYEAKKEELLRRL